MFVRPCIVNFSLLFRGKHSLSKFCFFRYKGVVTFTIMLKFGEHES